MCAQCKLQREQKVKGYLARDGSHVMTCDKTELTPLKRNFTSDTLYVNRLCALLNVT